MLQKLLFGCGAKDEARKYLEEAARFAFASQEAHDIDGCKCLAAIAIEFAKQGHTELAQKTASMVTASAAPVCVTGDCEVNRAKVLINRHCKIGNVEARTSAVTRLIGT